MGIEFVGTQILTETRKKSKFWLGKKSQLDFVSNMFGIYEPIVANFWTMLITANFHGRRCVKKKKKDSLIHNSILIREFHNSVFRIRDTRIRVQKNLLKKNAETVLTLSCYFFFFFFTWIWYWQGSLLICEIILKLIVEEKSDFTVIYLITEFKSFCLKML